MNAAFQLDHIHMMNNLSQHLEVSTTPTGANSPKSASTIHYGRDGKQIASQSQTSYEHVQVSNAGQITGGTLGHSAMDDRGNPLNSSVVTITPDGQANTIQTSINNRFDSGIFKTVETDLSGVQWTAAMSIHSGQVKIRTHHAASSQLRMEGYLTFDNERIHSGAYAHFAWAGDGKAHFYSEVDYSNAEFLGSQLVGGYCSVALKDVKHAVHAQSDMFVSPDGHVTHIQTKSFDPLTAKLRSQVETNLAGMSFDARGHFWTGSVELTVTSPEGDLRTKTNTTFNNSLPVQTVTQKYKNAKPSLKIVADYQTAAFNNDLRVVDSQVVSQVFTRHGKLLSTTKTRYDANGNINQKDTEHYKAGEPESSTTISSDYSSVVYDHRGTPIGGSAKVTTTDKKTGKSSRTEKQFAARKESPNGATTADFLPAPKLPGQPAPSYSRTQSTDVDPNGDTVKTEKITRVDGTLLQMKATKSDGSVPVSTVITNFATDGTTIINTHTIDLRPLNYDAYTHQITGHADIQSNFRGATLSASSKLQY